VLTLFARSSASPRARPLLGKRQQHFFGRMLVSRKAPLEQRHRRERFGNNLPLNRKVPLPLSIKWMNQRGRHKRMKGSLKNTRNGNRRRKIITVSYARASTLLVTLSLQLLRLDAVNIYGLMYGLMC
jgi:hypothetical protein